MRDPGGVLTKYNKRNLVENWVSLCQIQMLYCRSQLVPFWEKRMYFLESNLLHARRLLFYQNVRHVYGIFTFWSTEKPIFSQIRSKERGLCVGVLLPLIIFQTTAHRYVTGQWQEKGGHQSKSNTRSIKLCSNIILTLFFIVSFRLIQISVFS